MKQVTKKKKEIIYKNDEIIKNSDKMTKLQSDKRNANVRKFLISGNYGSGKTYFIDGELLSDVKKTKKVNFLKFKGDSEIDVENFIFRNKFYIFFIAKWFSFSLIPLTTLFATLAPLFGPNLNSINTAFLLFPIIFLIVIWLLFWAVWGYSHRSSKCIYLIDMNRINLDSESYDKIILYLTEKYIKRMFVIESDFEINDPRIVDMVINLPNDIKNIIEIDEWYENIYGSLIDFKLFYDRYPKPIIYAMLDNLLEIHSNNIREVKSYLFKCKKNLKLYNEHNGTNYDIFNLLYIRNYYKFYKKLLKIDDKNEWKEERKIEIASEKERMELLSSQTLIKHELFLDLKYEKIEIIEIGDTIEAKFATESIIKEKDISFVSFSSNQNFKFKKNIFLDWENFKDEMVLKYLKQTEPQKFVDSFKYLEEHKVDRILNILYKNLNYIDTIIPANSFLLLTTSEFKSFWEKKIPEFTALLEAISNNKLINNSLLNWFESLESEHIEGLNNNDLYVPSKIIKNIIVQPGFMRIEHGKIMCKILKGECLYRLINLISSNDYVRDSKILDLKDILWIFDYIPNEFYNWIEKDNNIIMHKKVLKDEDGVEKLFTSNIMGKSRKMIGLLFDKPDSELIKNYYKKYIEKINKINREILDVTNIKKTGTFLFYKDNVLYYEFNIKIDWLKVNDKNGLIRKLSEMKKDNKIIDFVITNPEEMIYHFELKVSHFDEIWG